MVATAASYAPTMFLVLSTSLSPTSRSRVLARRAAELLAELGQPAEFIDTAALGLPPCDGGAAYGHPAVKSLAGKIASAQGVLLCFPIYNYDAGSACKNLLELTGKAWTGQVVALGCAAGGANSYMAPMQIAGSLMLDFRCIVLPRYVYTTADAYQGDSVADGGVAERLTAMVRELVRVAGLLRTSA